MQNKLLNQINDLIIERARVFIEIEEYFRDNSKENDRVFRLINKWYDLTVKISALKDIIH